MKRLSKFAKYSAHKVFRVLFVRGQNEYEGILIRSIKTPKNNMWSAISNNIFKPKVSTPTKRVTMCNYLPIIKITCHSLGIPHEFQLRVVWLNQD